MRSGLHEGYGGIVHHSRVRIRGDQFEDAGVVLGGRQDGLHRDLVHPVGEDLANPRVKGDDDRGAAAHHGTEAYLDRPVSEVVPLDHRTLGGNGDRTRDEIRVGVGTGREHEVGIRSVSRIADSGSVVNNLPWVHDPVKVLIVPHAVFQGELQGRGGRHGDTGGIVPHRCRRIVGECFREVGTRYNALVTHLDGVPLQVIAHSHGVLDHDGVGSTILCKARHISHGYLHEAVRLVVVVQVPVHHLPAGCCGAPNDELRVGIRLGSVHDVQEVRVTEVLERDRVRQHVPGAHLIVPIVVKQKADLVARPQHTRDVDIHEARVAFQARLRIVAPQYGQAARVVDK
mmetsp:Transcript_36197/g.101995  ORF Transcript_36197/g.101995 Transcript_36197/m.101995 type:complete len:343 (-) Transcript_36197:1282-2310(-)